MFRLRLHMVLNTTAPLRGLYGRTGAAGGWRPPVNHDGAPAGLAGGVAAGGLREGGSIDGMGILAREGGRR